MNNNKSNNKSNIDDVIALEFKLALENEEFKQRMTEYMVKGMYNASKRYDIKKHIKYYINKKHKND